MSVRPSFTIKQGDTRERLAVRISSEPDDVLSSVRFFMSTYEGDTVIDGKPALIELQPSTDAQGIISYQWDAGDTATDGVYLAEFEVTFNDGRIETYPNYDYIEVRIPKALGT